MVKPTQNSDPAALEHEGQKAKTQVTLDGILLLLCLVVIAVQVSVRSCLLLREVEGMCLQHLPEVGKKAVEPSRERLTNR